MNIINDLRHLSKVARYGMKTLPSRVTEAQRFQRMKESAWRRAQAGRPSQYYQGADTGAVRGDWNSCVTSATSNIRNEFKRLCARSEMAYRTDAWARRAIQVITTFIVGTGIKPYPAVKMFNGELADGINAKLAQDWERFNDQGIRNGPQIITAYEAQRLELLTIAVYGNCLCNVVSSKPGSWLKFAYQFLKPTRLDFSKDTFFDSSNYEIMPSKKTIHGIEINSYGEPVKFYIEGMEQPISSDRMSLAYYPIETESYMGVPWLTQSLGNIWDNQQIFEDKMKQSRIAARLGYKISKDDQDAFESAATETSDLGESYIDLDFQGFVSTNGEITPIKGDDTLKESFNPLVKHNLIQLGCGLGFSYQNLTTDLEGMNFASSRANIINDNRFFRVIYKWFTKTVLQRRWEKFVEWEVLQNKIPGVTFQNYIDDPWYYTQCYWLPTDGEKWVDPLKDAEATKTLYGLGQITYQEICAMAGKDWRSVLKQIAKEREKMEELGLGDLLPNAQPAASPRKEKLLEPSEEEK